MRYLFGLRRISMRKFPDTPNWDAGLNHFMWKKYLKNGNFGLPGYASPLCNTDFSNLPQAYIKTAEFDCLCDEGTEYEKAPVLQELKSY